MERGLAAQQALCLEYEAQLRCLRRVLPVSFGVSVDGRLREVSEPLCELLGRSREELLGQPTAALDPALARAEIAAREDAAFRDQSVDAGWQRKDGSPVEVRVRVCPLEPGAPTRGILFTASIRTEHPQAEASGESERTFREIFNASSEAIFVHDFATGQILDVNEPMLRMFGVTREEALRLQPDDTSLGESPYSKREARQWLRRAATEGPQVFDWRAKRRSGELFWVEVSLKRVELGGQPCLLAVLRDITERKRTEEALRKSEAVLASFFASTPAGAGLLVNRVLRKVNTAMCRITGYSEEELVGAPTRMLYSSDEEHERAGRLLYGGWDTNNCRMMEGRLVRKDGRVINVLLGVSPFDPNDWSAGFASTVLDITERKQAEEALRDNEERLRCITSAALDAIVMMDERGAVSFWNQAAERLFGCTREEALGRPIHELIASPCHRAAYEDGLARFLQTSQGPVLGKTLELTARHRDGHEFPVELSVAAVRLRDRPQAVGIIRDISERKRAAEDLAKLEDQLRQTQKLEAIGTLAGGIAHDFNNILGAMIGYAEFARQASQDKPTVREDLDSVLQACERAKELVRQILSFSRQSKRERKPLDLHPLAKEALKLLRSSLPATIEMTERVGERLPQVLADPTQIHQVLLNLCTNAAHAMRGQVGRLEVVLEPFLAAEDFVRTHPDLRPSLYVRLRVSDTGHGMDEATLKRIFEPFFTTKAPGEGTGLGLSVVHGIVRDHDGAIYVRSQPGRGTTFELFFPALPLESDALPPTAAPLRRGHQERVLVVDDEPVLCRAICRMLSHLGYQATSCSNPREALADFERNPDRFDLVITDLTMPGMTGIDLAQAMLALHPRLPVLLASGFTGTYTPERVRELGLKGFLLKPIDLAQLGTAVHEVLASVRSPSSNGGH